MALLGSEVVRHGVSGYSAILYGSFAGKAAAPPVFAGTIEDISVKQNSGSYQYDYSTYFSGVVDSYSISPAVPSGWVFNTSTGVLTVTTTVKGTFGPFTVTATNTGGSDSSNAFDAAVTEAGAGAPKRVKQRKHKQIMIDGDVHVINSPEQEYFLVQAFLDKTRNKYEADILKKKTPQVKKNIKLLASKITRAENRLNKVEEQLKWRQKVKRNNQIILAMLAA